MKTFILLSLIILGFFTILSCNGQKTQLPKPSGEYLIGADYLSFTDKSRKELFNNNQDSYRDITVKVWYPSDIKGDYEPYLENADFAINNFNFPESYRNLITNSCKGVPLLKAEKTFPVLIFSHGWGEHFSQNTILMEELASNGYVVFSQAHHFECKFSFYPDGQIVSLDNNSERFRQIMREQQNPKAMELYNAMFQTNSDSERIQIFTKTSNLMPTLLQESPKYWVADIEFFINQLTVRNSDHYNFTDYALYPTQPDMMVGPIDPILPIKIMNSMVLGFFDKYVLGENGGDLQVISQKYDVEYVANK